MPSHATVAKFREITTSGGFVKLTRETFAQERAKRRATACSIRKVDN